MGEILFLKIFLLLLVVLHAYIDSNLIKNNVAPNHAFEGVVFALVTVAFIYCFKVNFLKTSTFVLVARIGVFDFVLNGLRGLSLFYNNSLGVSFWDKIFVKSKNAIRVVCFLLTIYFLIYGRL